jgi:hypothetical protein
MVTQKIPLLKNQKLLKRRVFSTDSVNKHIRNEDNGVCKRHISFLALKRLTTFFMCRLLGYCSAEWEMTANGELGWMKDQDTAPNGETHGG